MAERLTDEQRASFEAFFEQEIATARKNTRASIDPYGSVWLSNTPEQQIMTGLLNIQEGLRLVLGKVSIENIVVHRTDGDFPIKPKEGK